MTRSRFYAAIFLLLPLYLFLLKPMNVADLSIWIALGRDSLAAGRLLVHDTYSVAPTATWSFPPLAPLLYGALYTFCSTLVIASLHALVPVAWVATWLRARARPDRAAAGWGTAGTGEAARAVGAVAASRVLEPDGLDTGAIVVFAGALVGTMPAWVPRPALLATLPLIAVYAWPVEGRRGTRPDAWLILNQIVWVNLHGSFILQPLILGWRALGRVANRDGAGAVRALALAAASLLACLANPFGWKMFPYIAETARASAKRSLTEWSPTIDFIYPLQSAYFLIFVCAFAAFAIVNRARWREIVFDPITPLTIAGVFAIRHTILPFVVLPLFAAKFFEGKPTESKNRANAVLIALLVLAILTVRPKLDPRTHSDEIDAYLRSHEGTVYNDYALGSDLALEQPNKHFLDSRIIFSDEDDRAYEDSKTNPHAVDKYGFKYFVVARGSILENDPDVALVLKTGELELFERK